MIRRLLASAAALALLAAAPHAAAQTLGGHGKSQSPHGPPACRPNQVCTAEIPPPNGDVTPPSITFTPNSGTTVQTQPFSVTVGYCDNTTLMSTSVRDTFNNVSVGPNYSSSVKTGCGGYGVGTLSLTPVAGSNTLVARVCDTSGNCTRATATYNYVAADQIAPTIQITPANGAVPSATPFVGVKYCDERRIGTVHSLTLNGTMITDSLNFGAYSGCGSGKDGMQSFGSVRLRSGTNTFVATVQDSAGNTGTATATWTYTPTLDTSPTNQTSLRPQFSDAVLSYSMPTYRSLDQDRGVTLVYSSYQARPFVTVQLDVTDNGSAPAPTTSFHVSRNGATWALPDGRTSDMFYQSGQGGNRLTALYGASNMASGSYNLTAAVTRWLSGGGTEPLSAPMRVLVLNESNSVFGAGWSLAGLERVVLGDGGILVSHGDATATFYPAYTSCNAQKICSFGHTPGEFGTMVYDSVNAIYLRTARDRTKATFSATGYLTGVQDRLGNTQTYAYDTSNRLVSITDPAGLVTTLAYDINGKISTITDPTGRVSVFTVNASGDLASVRDPDNVNALQMSYGANRPHRLDWYTDRAGRRTDVTYDVFGRVATRVSPSFTAEQNQTFRMTESVTSTELAAEGSYTGGTQAAPLPRVNPATFRVSSTDPQGRVTHYVLDPWGVPARVEDPRGFVSTTTRNTEGQVTNRVDAMGNQTIFTWSGGNLMQVRNATGSIVTTYAYDVSGAVTSVTGDMATVKNWYSATTGVLDSTSTGSDTTRYVYDSRGRVLTVTDPEHHLTTRVYADTSRFRNRQSETSTGRTTRYRFDAYGHTASVTRPDGRVTSYVYDPLNRLTRTITPDQGQTSFTWGPLFLDQVTDPRGQVYTWTRNALGLVEKETRPGDAAGTGITYEYDRYGRGRATVNRRGQRVEVSYDAADRVISRLADGQTTTFTYSPDDPAHPDAPVWTVVANAESIDTLRLDGKGRVTDEVTVRTIAGVQQRVSIQPRYDQFDRPVGYGIGGPAGRDTIGWGYSATTFQLNSLRDLGGGSTTFGYNRDGMLSTRTMPGGSLTISNSYTSRHALGGIRYSNLSLDAVAGAVYTYDDMNRVIEQRNPTSDGMRNYQYNLDGRWLSTWTDYVKSGNTHPSCTLDLVIGWTCTDPQGYWQVLRSDTYSYDKTGNPLDHGAVQGAGDRLAQYNGFTLTYDGDGNLATKSGSGLSQSFSWNSLGQLTSVTTNGTVVSYGYNGVGQRVRKTANSADTHFVYSGDRLLMELTGSGVQAKYTYYPGGQPHSMVRGGTTYYYATDAQGSVLALFNSAGSVVNSYAYRPFGEAVSANEAAGAANRIRFAGREFETETGLYYNNARWYDPGLHRFISQDPSGIAGGVNVYAYTGNDPVNFVDPTGRKACIAIYEVWGEFTVEGGKETLRHTWTEFVGMLCFDSDTQDHIDVMREIQTLRTVAMRARPRPSNVHPTNQCPGPRPGEGPMEGTALAALHPGDTPTCFPLQTIEDELYGPECKANFSRAWDDGNRLFPMYKEVFATSSVAGRILASTQGKAWIAGGGKFASGFSQVVSGLQVASAGITAGRYLMGPYFCSVIPETYMNFAR